MLLNTDSDKRETRRKLFLKKVKETAEEKRWKDRGGDEEMMRQVWVLEERRRGERLRGETEFLRAGEDVTVEEEEELRREEAVTTEQLELEAVLKEEQEMMLQEGQHRDQMMDSGNRMEYGGETPYGSDDEEYDDIFMDVIQEEMRMGSQMDVGSSQRQQQVTQVDGDQSMLRTEDMMDMS